MELKRLLTRANALLLQGAYQGAESFIEQAMAEAEKLKSELAELDTLRTRVTEIAAEVERLRSVIDEANAQKQCDSWVENEFIGPPPIGYKDWYDWMLSPVKKFAYIESRPMFSSAQQSPAVAVPEINLNPKNDREMLLYLMNAFDTEHSICEKCEHQEETKDMDSAYFLREYLQNNKAASPRITEQDALQKLRTEVGEAINILAMCGDKTPFDQLGKKLVAAFNDSSSPKLNEAKHD